MNGEVMKRQPELDFIRGVAILMVLHFHISSSNILIHPTPNLPFINFGWAGVNLFFILSGFLVGGLLCREWKNRGCVDVGRFLKRRGFKIWPAYYFYFLVHVIVRKHPLTSFFWPNLLNYQNYVRTPLSHTWSLAIEEHFYILLTGVIWWCSTMKVSVRGFFRGAMVTAVGVAVYRTCLALAGKNYFFQTHTRIDGLLLGVMLAALFHFDRDRFMRLQRKTWPIGLVLGASVAVLLFTPEFSSSGIQVIAADLGSAALFLLLYKPGLEGHGLVYRGVAAIGIYSYGIYLWHIGVISPVEHAIGHFPRVAPYIQYPATLAVALLVGIVMTKLVELPFLRLREKLFPSVEIAEPSRSVAIPGDIDGRPKLGPDPVNRL